MKKYFLIVGIGLSLVLVWCSKTDTPVETDAMPNTENSTQTQDLSINTPEMCSSTIKDYLAKADLIGKWDKIVEKGIR
jgi:hypothetical protein